MGKFTSEIDICNDAIARVGGKFISSIETPTTHTETLLSSIYAKNRRIVLRSAVWNFAKTLKTITKSTETLSGFSGVYPLPNDFVRFLGVQNMDLMGSETDRYMLSDNKLYLKDGSADSIVLIYIKDVTDVTCYDALFVEAFSLRLSYNLQYALSGKNTTSDRLLQEYRDALQDAKMIDGQEQKPIKVQRSRWLSARHRGRSSTYASTERYFGD